MKFIFKNKYWGIGLLIVLFAIGIIPFIAVFHNSIISTSITDMGSFGSYLSGIIGVINVFVFIYISYLVSKLDDKRSNDQINAQYRILLSQFRQNELDKLNNILDNVFDSTGNEEKNIIINKFVNSGTFLTNFLNQKKYLFPIIEEYKIKTTIENIVSTYSQLIDITDELYGKSYIENWKEEKLNTKIQFAILLKSELIECLQQFILDDLKK